MSKNGDRGKELLGKVKGGVKLCGPQERFAGALKGVGERRKDLGGILEKSPIEINHTEKTLQSRFILGGGKSVMADVCLERGRIPELERWCPRNSVFNTENSHLPMPIVRP